MTVSVLIPFASEEPWRIRAFDHVAGGHRAAGFDVVEGCCDGPWRKAVAVADAASRTDADVLVVADADCCCDRVDRAVRAVVDGASWAIPHGTVHRLDEAATETVYGGVDPAATVGRTQRPYLGFAGGGITVVSRAVWEAVPMDPRFCGWGGEDSAWALALNVLAGPPVRFDADLFHLWHPPAPRMSRRWGSPAGRALELRYKRAARAGRRQMADLVAEAARAAAVAA